MKLIRITFEKNRNYDSIVLFLIGYTHGNRYLQKPSDTVGNRLIDFRNWWLGDIQCLGRYLYRKRQPVTRLERINNTRLFIVTFAEITPTQ